MTGHTHSRACYAAGCPEIRAARWIHRPDWSENDRLCDWWTDEGGALVRCTCSHGHDGRHAASESAR